MITPRISVAPRMMSKKRQASKRGAGDGPTNESIGILDDTIAKVLSSDENDPETVVRIDERERDVLKFFLFNFLVQSLSRCQSQRAGISLRIT